jgi:hypothetical protein
MEKASFMRDGQQRLTTVYEAALRNRNNPLVKRMEQVEAVRSPWKNARKDLK